MFAKQKLHTMMLLKKDWTAETFLWIIIMCIRFSIKVRVTMVIEHSHSAIDRPIATTDNPPVCNKLLVLLKFSEVIRGVTSASLLPHLRK